MPFKPSLNQLYVCFKRIYGQITPLFLNYMHYLSNYMVKLVPFTWLYVIFRQLHGWFIPFLLFHGWPRAFREITRTQGYPERFSKTRLLWTKEFICLCLCLCLSLTIIVNKASSGFHTVFISCFWMFCRGIHLPFFSDQLQRKLQNAKPCAMPNTFKRSRERPNIMILEIFDWN